MKRILLVTIVSLTIALAACSPASTPTATPPTATPPPPSPTEPPAATTAPPAEVTTEPGGVDVALSLVTIPDQEIIAIVNGEEISTAAYEEDLTQALHATTKQYMVDWNDPQNQSFLPALQQQILEQAIDLVLLRQLARQEGVSAAADEIQTEVTELQAQVEESEIFADWTSFLTENGLTEESLRQMIADSLLTKGLTDLMGGPKVVEQVRASHILVETEETGQEVLDRLANDEPFAALAAEYSIDPGSKAQGGDLGWFPRGQMVPDFEEAAFSLEPDETSDLVKSDFGYHIIHVVAKGERELAPDLYEQRQQQEFQEWFTAERAAATVERLYSFETSE